MKNSFSTRLFASYVFLILLVLGFTSLLLTPRLRNHFLDQLEESLLIQTSLMLPSVQAYVKAPAVSEAGENLIRELDKRARCRVTLIRQDGLVMGDSERTLDEARHMDNHLDRPEIQAAARSGHGRAIRFSHTLNEDMLYVATAVPGGGFLRVALPVAEIEHRVNTLRRNFLVAGGIAILIAIALAVFLARRATQPLSALTRYAEEIGQDRFPEPPSVKSSDEFGQLGNTFVGMASRIEEKVRELSLERAQLAAILSGLVESVLAVDQEGRLLFLNEAASKLFQVDAVAKSRPFVEVLRHSALSGFLRRAVGQQTPSSEEITLHVPEEHILAAHAVPLVFEESGRGILVILHDVTDLRKLERIRQEFVANVSHELKTPLTAIQWYTETLLNGGLEDAKNNREFLGIMLENTQRLGRLIDDILDLSAMEAKRMPFRFEPVAVNDVAARLIQSLAPLAQTKKVTIKNQLKDTLPRVTADREKLAQILLNLLDNAVKFNKVGGTVTISAVVQRDQLEVSVQDDGPGIPEADLPRLFERFYRVDKARSREMGGTGLGLSIVKHLVESHHGKISVQSTLNQGSTFSFSVPLA